MLLLHDLLRQLQPAPRFNDVPNVRITGIQEDSRLIRPGNLFLSRAGSHAVGSQFLEDARSNGAIAVVTAEPLAASPLPQIIVWDWAAAADLVHAFHGHPSQKLKVLAITGTNGKTTTTYLLRHVLNQFNQRCGLIGTVEIDTGSSSRESSLTTPGLIELAQHLAAMRDANCRAAAIEASSHSLHQRRTAGIHFAGAAFTNLTGDHLDYHQTMDNYAAAKAILFEGLGEHAVAAVNMDDPWASRMIQNCPARICRFGFTENADYRAKDIAITTTGAHFILHTPDGQAQVDLQLIGKHNIQNALAAATLLGEVFGLNVHQIAAGLKDAPGAPGRLQPVRAGQPFAVLVDYAHTDDALENVLSALRPLTRGRLRVLFGCGGDRDRSKRPRMAATAQKFADAIYLTSDNPRTENPQSIVNEIATGFSDVQNNPIFVEVDRHRAIEHILSDAQPNDVVLIAGKGHENYQIVGTTKHHFDDVEECMKILKSESLSA